MQQWGNPDDAVIKMAKDMEVAVQKLKSLRFKNNKTINRMVQSALDLESSRDKVNKPLQRKNAKYSRQILNCLYRMDKDRFLRNFTEKSK